MANTPVVVMDDTLTDIADAIRSKTGSQATMKPGQMATQISSIPVGSLGIPREVSSNGYYRAPSSTGQEFAFSLPATVDTIAEYALAHAFYRNNQPYCAITSISLSNTRLVYEYGCLQMCYKCDKLLTADCGKITTLSSSNSFTEAFRNCSALKSADFSSLSTVSGSYALSDAFRYCSSLSSVNFNSLYEVTGSWAFSSAFDNCTSLTSISFPALSKITAGNCFRGAFGNSGLTSVTFPSLSTLTGNAAFYSCFSSCSSLTSVSFPALTASSFGSYTSQFGNMLYGVTGCTVHFPAAIQSTIGSWLDVTDGFGGTNTTVLFDL